MKVSIKKLKPLYIFSLFLSIIACLADVIFLIYLIISNKIGNIDILFVVSAIVCVVAIIKLNHDILFENYKYSLLKSSNETKAKIYSAFILTTAVLNLAFIILFFNNK